MTAPRRAARPKRMPALYPAAFTALGAQYVGLALERARWPLSTLGVISGLGGAVAAAVALLQH